MRLGEKISRLFDFAVEHEDGFTYQDVQEELGWKRAEFFKVANRMRLMLGNDDTINLVCEPQGPSEPWRYKLIGNLRDAGRWNGNRLQDCESRILTIHAVLASIVQAVDGRTSEGKRARVMHRMLGRLIEDLAELDHGPPLF